MLEIQLCFCKMVAHSVLRVKWKLSTIKIPSFIFSFEKAGKCPSTKSDMDRYTSRTPVPEPLPSYLLRFHNLGLRCRRCDQRCRKGQGCLIRTGIRLVPVCFLNLYNQQNLLCFISYICLIPVRTSWNLN